MNFNYELGENLEEVASIMEVDYIPLHYMLTIHCNQLLDL